MRGNPNLDAAQLARAIERGDAPLIVDTRSRLEYAADHIAGAIHLPFWRIGARHRELAAEADTHIVLYCGHGPRAMWARRALDSLGYRRVGLLTGHYRGWKQR